MKADTHLFKVGSENALSAIIAENYLTVNSEQVRVCCIIKHYLWLNNLSGTEASWVFKQERFSVICNDSASLCLNFDLL